MHSPENNSGEAPPRRIGEILVSQGRIAREQLTEALWAQQQSDGQHLGRVLVSLGYISEKDLAHALSTRLNVDYVELSDVDVDPGVLNVIPEEALVKHHAVPLRIENGRLLVAMSDPNDLQARSDLTLSSGYPIATVISARDDLEEIQDRLFAGDSPGGNGSPRADGSDGARSGGRRPPGISERKIGEILVSQGRITGEQLQEAISVRENDPRDLGKILVSLGFVTPADVARALAQRLKLEYVVISELSEDEVDPEVLSSFSEETLRKYRVLPLRHENEHLVVAMYDPNDIHALEDIRIIARRQIRPVVASEDDLEGAFMHLFDAETIDEGAVEDTYPEDGYGDIGFPETQEDVSSAEADSSRDDIDLKVMIAEDDAVSRMIAVRAVEGFGCECVEACDGQEAWRLYQEDPGIDVILSDWMMPGMDGLELCQRVRELGRPQHTYFVFLTALGDEQHLTDGIEAGADEYLIKPLNRDLLRTKLEDAYRAKSLYEHLGSGEDNTPATQGRELALRTDAQPAPGDKVWDILISDGKLDEGQLRHALEVQVERRDELGKVLVSLGYISHRDLAQAQAARFRLGFMELTENDVDKSVIALVEQKVLRKYNVMPLRIENNRLVVAISDPTNIFALEDLTMLSGYPITPVVALEEDITTVHNKLFAFGEDVSEFLQEASRANFEQDIGELDLGVESSPDEAPIIRLVSAILTQAVGDGASDIHIEPQPGEVMVRMRVDGVLREAMTIPPKLQSGVVTRLKIVGDLDIAERRVPQDGRFSVKLAGQRIDLRVVSLPTVYGEKVTLRLLDTSHATVELPELGFLPKTYRDYEEIFRRPYGTVLVVGPTGSGKSTTLYATLNELNTPDRNIITVEDPVEYRMRGVTQIQTNARAGLDFARALRSILRADPDVMMIGEIRDIETAKIAVEAALTGHLVLATLHTNNAPAAVSRLTDMGVEPFLTSSAVDCVVAQRLARRLCEFCKQPAEIEREILESMQFPFEHAEGKLEFYKGVGCKHCGDTGYRGRLGLYELMVVTEEIRSLILRRAPTEEISRLAEKEGMIKLREDGLLKAAQGMTTVEEVFRTVV